MAWKSGAKATEMVVRQALRGTQAFYETSGSIVMYQMKPDIKTGGTTSVTGLEVGPRFTSGAAGADMRGIAIECWLRGSGAAGNLSATMIALETKVCSDSGSTRTVAGPVACLRCINDMHGTVTSGPYMLYAVTHGGNVAWAGFALLPDDGTVSDSDANQAVTSLTTAGWIKVVIGTATRYIWLASNKPTGP